MKKYRFNLNTVIVIISIITLLIATAGILLSLAKIFGWFNKYSDNFPLEVTSIICCTIIIVVMLTTLHANYTFKDDMLRFRISFLKTDVMYEDIKLIREETSSQTLCIFYVKKETKDTIYPLMININNERKEQFVAELKKRNKNIIYEVFDKSNKDDDLEQ